MPVQNIGGVITKTPAADMDEFLQTGVMRADQFAFKDTIDQTKQIAFDCSGQATATTVTIKAGASTSGTVTLPNTANPTLAAAGGAGSAVFSVPTEASTTTIASTTTKQVLVPAAGLTTLNVVLPTTPPNGYSVRFSTTQTITNFNLSGGGSDTIANAITTLAANAFAEYVYKAASTQWYRIG